MLSKHLNGKCRTEHPQSPHGMPKRTSLAICFAVVSASMIIVLYLLLDVWHAVPGEWEDIACDLLFLLCFPSLLLLLAASPFLPLFIWPDSIPDGVWLLLLSMIVSVCFWAVLGWAVGWLLDRRKAG